MPENRRYFDGAQNEFVYSSKLSLKYDSISETRNIECYVSELANASIGMPLAIRTNEVVPMELTPQLRLFKKAENGLKGTEITSSNDPVELNLGEKVCKPACLCLFI